MDTDSYGGFVSLDVETLKPIFRLGFLGGTQYADLDADPRPPARDFRHSLEVVKRAVEYYKANSVYAVAHLGDVLAAENVQGGSQAAAMQSFDTVRSRLSAAWYVSPGACDVACFGLENVGASLRPAGVKSERSYYVIFPAARWRILVLDSSNAGSLGEDGEGSQLEWLEEQLQCAESDTERVIICCNRSVSSYPGATLLANAEPVAELLKRHPGVVAAVLSLGDGTGGYLKDASGTHHISPVSVISRGVNEDAFGCLEVFDEHLGLEMVGPPPAEVEWPRKLPLPSSGKLVVSDGGGVFAFLQVFFFILSYLATPISPFLRLLGAAPEPDTGEPPSADAEPAAAAGRPAEPARPAAAAAAGADAPAADDLSGVV